MDWGRNLIRFRTANFLLNRLQTFLLWSWKDNLLSIVKPRHLDEGLSSMVLVPYLRAGGGPIKIDLDIIIASVFDWRAISLLAVHHMCSWDRIHRSEVACVASVPVRAKRSIGPREGVFAFGTRGKWGESKKDEGEGWGSRMWKLLLAAWYFVQLVRERLLRRQTAIVLQHRNW